MLGWPTARHGVLTARLAFGHGSDRGGRAPMCRRCPPATWCPAAGTGQVGRRCRCCGSARWDGESRLRRRRCYQRCCAPLVRRRLGFDDGNWLARRRAPRRPSRRVPSSGRHAGCWVCSYFHLLSWNISCRSPELATQSSRRGGCERPATVRFVPEDLVPDRSRRMTCRSARRCAVARRSSCCFLSGCNLWPAILEPVQPQIGRAHV